MQYFQERVIIMKHILEATFAVENQEKSLFMSCFIARKAYILPLSVIYTIVFYIFVCSFATMLSNYEQLIRV